MNEANSTNGSSGSAPTPPPPSAPPPSAPPPKKGMGCGSLLLLLVLGGVIGVGGYAAWPMWSPYVAPYVPQLEYGPDKDPRGATLVGRIKALEDGAKDRTAAEKSLGDLEEERGRLQEEVSHLLARLDTIEGALDGVKQMIAATGVVEKADEAKASINRLADRLAVLEAKEGEAAALRDQIGRLEMAAGDVARLKDRIGRLETEEGGEGSPEPAVQDEESRRLTEMLEDIRGRLAELESRKPVAAAPQPAPKLEGSAAVLAMGQLREAVMAGKPFVQELEALRSLAGSAPDLAAAIANLERQAAGGVATVSRLHRDFVAIAGDIVTATRELEGEGWFEKAANRVLSMVSVRRVDGRSDSASVEGIVALTEKSLEKGDLVAAIESVERLPEIDVKAATVAAEWLKKAQARLSVERAVAQLHVYAVSLVAPATN